MNDGTVERPRPGHLRGIGWCILRSHDKRRLADFYVALGFEEVSTGRIIGMWAGDNQSVLEIGDLDPDVAPLPPITRRTQRSQCAGFGTHQLDAVVAAARANGAMFVEKLDSPGANLWYIGDPDGNVVAFADNGPLWGNLDEAPGVRRPTPWQLTDG